MWLCAHGKRTVCNDGFLARTYRTWHGPWHCSMMRHHLRRVEGPHGVGIGTQIAAPRADNNGYRATLDSSTRKNRVRASCARIAPLARSLAETLRKRRSSSSSSSVMHRRGPSFAYDAYANKNIHSGEISGSELRNLLARAMQKREFYDFYRQ